MVPDAGAATGAGRLRPLNNPRPLAVVADEHLEPRAVVVRGVYRPVAAIHDSWRIDDEWWRAEVARRYFVLELQGGRRLTAYHDLVADLWYAQSYDGPQTAAATRGKGR